MLPLTSILAASGLLYIAVTESPIVNNSPDLTGLAAIITAAIGAIAFLLSIWRGKENNKKVAEIEEAATYVQGIDSFTKRLRDEIDEVREEQHSERNKWLEEKSLLQVQLSELRKELSEAVVENYKLRSELLAVKEEIKKYLSPEEYEEFSRNLG